jgi:two-component system sensor histidine kinase CiaH
MLKVLNRRFNMVLLIALSAIIGTVFVVINIATYINIEQRISQTVRENYIKDKEFGKFQLREGKKRGSDQRFYVIFRTDGETEINIENISDIDSDTALMYADAAVKSGLREGYIQNEYKYIVVSTAGGTEAYFMDTQRFHQIWSSFFLITVITCAAMFCGAYLALHGLSRKFLKPIVENMSKQQRFITDASHELKTPISVINADAEVIEMTEGKSEWTRSIKRQTARLTSLTNRMLALARASQQDEKESFEKTDIAEIALESSEEFRPRAVTENIEFFTDIEDEVVIVAKKEAMRWLMDILTDNALKYAGEKGKVKVSLKKEAKTAVYRVENTFSDDILPDMSAVFDRFYRADGSRSRKTGGFGLGLSIAKAIADIHKAEIKAEMQDGKVIFSVYFKL